MKSVLITEDEIKKFKFWRCFKKNFKTRGETLGCSHLITDKCECYCHKLKQTIYRIELSEPKAELKEKRNEITKTPTQNKTTAC